MEENIKACYTPEEIKEIVFAGTVSLSTIRSAIHKGDIPHIRLGSGTRTKLLVPGTYVKEMQDKGFVVPSM